MKNYSISSSNEKFECIYKLVDYVVQNGICPSCKVLVDGEFQGEYIVDFLVE